MPLDITNQNLVYVGRIREDLSDSTHHSLSLFCCGDQIRKGAATNAVQILELLLNQEKNAHDYKITSIFSILLIRLLMYLDLLVYDQ